MSPQDTPPTASQKRAAHPDFIPTFSREALQDRLPFPFPVPPGLPPSPKGHYRSQYRYVGSDDLADPAVLTTLTLFEVALRLIDGSTELAEVFFPLRDLLAQGYYRPSARGQVPFDPVSLFGSTELAEVLCLCLRRELRLSWRTLAKLLAGEHGAGWRRLFGFLEGVTPSASGLRYFFHTLGAALFEELCPHFADLLHQAALLPEHSTFPGDPPERGVTISHDLMLHEARSTMGCPQVTETCYAPAPRPCPAKAAGKAGCDCTEAACAQACRRTTPLDREARFIHYAGRNQDADLVPPDQARGRDVYGYASTPDRLLDGSTELAEVDRFACAWTLRTALHPANADERELFPTGFGVSSAERLRHAAGSLPLADHRRGIGRRRPGLCLLPGPHLGRRRPADGGPPGRSRG